MPVAAPSPQKLDVAKIREDFPILHQKVHGRPYVYFDNAATSQKPQQVIDVVDEYYRSYNSNIHRGVHHLSQKATDVYESARQKVQCFINAPSAHEINFVRGTTEAVNLVAQSYGRKFLKEGDEIIITTMEHHSNIVPWQMVCEQTGAKLKIAPINDRGEIVMEEYEKLLSEKTRIVATNHISNALGTINPIKAMIQKAHEVGAVFLVDGAQAAMHCPIDVQDLDADFYAFSGHKMCGPTGAGILYGKDALLEKMDPYMGGGEMIKSVSFEKTTYNELPYKFEAGTPNIAGGIGLGAAIDYLQDIGLENIEAYDKELLDYGTEKMNTIEGMRIIGRAEEKTGVISFLIGDHHPFDVGVLLDKQAIAIRTGHHCCQPLMGNFCITGTCRASFAFYNTKEEIDQMIVALEKAVGMLE